VISVDCRTICRQFRFGELAPSSRRRTSCRRSAIPPISGIRNSGSVSGPLAPTNAASSSSRLHSDVRGLSRKIRRVHCVDLQGDTSRHQHRLHRGATSTNPGLGFRFTCETQRASSPHRIIEFGDPYARHLGITTRRSPRPTSPGGGRTEPLAAPSCQALATGSGRAVFAGPKAGDLAPSSAAGQVIT